VKNQHGIRAWLAVSKTQNLQKFGSLKFSLFWDSSSLDSEQEGRKLFSAGWGLQSYFGFQLS
jgi:hypothetical protein